MGAHLELLTGVLVHVRRADNRVQVALGGQGDRTGNASAGLLSGLDDELRGLIDDLVIIALEANADLLGSQLKPPKSARDALADYVTGSSNLGVLAHDLVHNGLGRGLIRVELHRVGCTALGLGAKVGSVTEHLAQRHLGTDELAVLAILHALDLAAATGEVAHNVAHVLLGGLDLDSHDRLEQLRIGLLEGVLDSHGTGDLEGGLGGVDLVVRTVEQGDLNVEDREAGDNTGVQGLLDALVDGRDVLLGHDAADDSVDELVAEALLHLLELDDGVAVLTATAGLTDELASAFSTS